MTVKERVLRHLERLDEAQLEKLEKELQGLHKDLPLEEEFRLLDELALPMSDEDKAAFQEASKRRPLFGGRRLEIEPDPENAT